MNKILDTDNFYIQYTELIYDYQNQTNNIIVVDVYRSYLYKKLIQKLKDIHKKEIRKAFVTSDHTESIIFDKKNDFVSKVLIIDIMSILIMNHKFKSNLDPIFDCKSPFRKSKLIKYFDDKCMPIFSNKVIDSTILILPNISKYYKRYYKRINNKLLEHFFDNIKYNIRYEIIQNNVFIYFNLDNNKFLKKTNYLEIIPIQLHIFNHLVKLYNTKMLNNYLSNEVLDAKVIEYIYMIFNRYSILSSGNNQASLLPSFKKLLKEKLNIKIELFGSPINTSNSSFGSIFYDIESVFGSLGNVFRTNIIKGYYELNPIFDKCIIDTLILKCTNELIESQKKSNKLLFFFILPISYFKYSNLPDQLNEFIKFSIILEKNDFPYIRYNRNYTRTIVSPIVMTQLIICHTSFISNYVKFNVINFKKLLDAWKK